MNYVLNTITFLLLSVNGDVIYLDHKFDPRKYNCETYYESKTTYFDKSNTRIFNQYKAYTFGYICSDIEFHDLYDPDSLTKFYKKR